MSVWFSASAVVPELTQLWHLDDSGRAWLTMSVQIGFVVGALTLGFLLTLFTIRLIPSLVSRVGWEWAFVILAIVPMVGIWAMPALRHSPAAAQLAGGRR